MKALVLLAATFMLLNGFGQKSVTPVIKFTVGIKPLESSFPKLIANAKVAQEYYVLSEDTTVGRSFAERKSKYLDVLDSLVLNFVNTRRIDYRSARLEISSSASSEPNIWEEKTAVIPRDTYTFLSITKSDPIGDFKLLPTVEGWNRPYYKGTIAGGSVTWTTGGHKSAYTKWVIKAKYCETYIEKMLTEETVKVMDALSSNEIMVE